MKTKTTPEPEKVVEEVIEELFKLLGVKAKSLITRNDEAVIVQLQTEQEGMLIGYHGETLNALQLMVSLITYRKLGEWVKVVVEIGDYRQKREETLVRMAQAAVEKVKSSGSPEALPPMPAFERRIIHMALAQDNKIETVSEGETDRHVVIKLRAQ